MKSILVVQFFINIINDTKYKYALLTGPRTMPTKKLKKLPPTLKNWNRWGRETSNFYVAQGHAWYIWGIFMPLCETLIRALKITR